MISRSTFMACFVSGIVTVFGASGQASASDETRYPPIQGDTARTMPPPPPATAQRRNAPPQYRPQPRRYAPPAQYGPAQYGPAPYGRPAPYPGGAPYGYRGPYGAAPYQPYGGGWNRGPWGGNRGYGPWGGNRGPYGNNNPFDGFFGGNRYGNGPFGDFFGGRGFGGRDGFLGMHPEDWFTGNPEDGLSYMWDDMINAPSEMGEMPGGWSAPEVSMPNPIDIGSEFREETPNLIREIPDMININ